jgi:hypothetical protein
VCLFMRAVYMHAFISAHMCVCVCVCVCQIRLFSHMLLIKKMMKNALPIGTMERKRILKMLRTVLKRPSTRSTRQHRNSSSRSKGNPTGARLISERLTITKSNMHHRFLTNGQNQRESRLTPSSAANIKTNAMSSPSRIPRV